MQTDHVIPARWPDLVKVKKKKRKKRRERTCRIVDFVDPDDYGVKLKESEKRDKYLDIAWDLNPPPMKHGNNGDTSCNWCARYSHQRINKGTGGRENKRMSGDHPNYSIFEIGQNTTKSPGDFRKLAVTQTPVENHQLTPVWKTLKRVK